MKRVLLTGASGRIGSYLRGALAQDFALHLNDVADLGPARANETLFQGDLTDPDLCARMVAGLDAIAHFGGRSGIHSFADVLHSNIVGMQVLYEAARKAGVRRIVWASSNHVTGFHPVTEVIDPASPRRPDSFYGVSKSFGEDLSRFYFDRFGIETLCLRIGSCFPEPTARRMLATWLSHRDLEQLVRLGLSAGRIGHMVVYATSETREGFWHSPALRVLGYRPKDDADAFAARFDGPSPERFQGGPFATAPLAEDRA